MRATKSARWSMRRWGPSASPDTATGRRRGCRAASSNASRSPARSCTSRRLLLLDEPLSNLDAALREEMRIELRRLQQQIGLTTVYVTHDQAEALAMSDRIAVMELGLVAQMDEPRAIYFRPANAFVARFIGAANLLHGKSELNTGAGGAGTVLLDDGSRIGCIFPSRRR